MKTGRIYILDFKDGKKIVCKSLTDLHNEYENYSNHIIKRDRFKYIINNSLYNTDKTYKHKGVEYVYKLDVIDNVEIHNLEEYLKDRFDTYMKAKELVGNAFEYKERVKKLKYSKIYDKFKSEIECNARHICI